MVTFCASCLHGLKSYADLPDVLGEEERTTWLNRVKPLSALLEKVPFDVTGADDLAARAYYHSPPPLPLAAGKGSRLQAAFQALPRTQERQVSLLRLRRCPSDAQSGSEPRPRSQMLGRFFLGRKNARQKRHRHHGLQRMHAPALRPRAKGRQCPPLARPGGHLDVSPIRRTRAAGRRPFLCLSDGYKKIGQQETRTGLPALSLFPAGIPGIRLRPPRCQDILRTFR